MKFLYTNNSQPLLCYNSGAIPLIVHWTVWWLFTGQSVDSPLWTHCPVVMFRTTDSTLSLSPLEMLHRCIVDHHTLPVVCSLCLSRQFPYQSGSSSTLLYAKTPLPYLRHFTCQQTMLNTCILTQHLGVWSHMEQIPYVQFSLPHICIILPYATLIIPHVIFKISHMLVALHYPSCFIPSVYKLQVPILYFLSFEYQI